ncbi:sugar phosphate isomerase/epimerase family protein [Gracilibacillus sp. S3-1-1]|uniref:Sugar phosphate isomerase/epimerase family protein n=1 Tax=Gracilibacillus pellucidus TaxID=3095368 RepID=A0ACC6M1E7_9BACI|nr:sugar phosphate isomerase/epimerase family protein [Gracilibacillus sp. S3-1-1]MDX8044547.1 sugar phosphate isomerase/epimerase family protein [Gracilibacillus sp. S3-1-1]
MTNNQLMSRLSLNQITTEQWNLQEAVEGCLRHDVPRISVWRHKIEEVGLKQASRLIKGAGLQVSSICRGGMFPAATAKERAERLDDNKRAVEEAAELDTDTLVLVCGPSADKDIDTARAQVAEGIDSLVPFAKDYGVKLAIEPLHPMFAADRSVINTMNQASTIAENYNQNEVGVIVDVYHVWWDPNLYAEIERAKGRILGFHVSDWKVPMADMFKGRFMMGDGVIEINRMRKAVEQAGYNGPIEVEIINQSLWDRAGDDVLQEVKQSFAKYV